MGGTRRVDTISAVELARLFHDTYEQLAPLYGVETRIEARSFDGTTRQGALEVRTAEGVLVELRRMDRE